MVLRRRALRVAAGAGPGGSDLITLDVADERALATEIGALGGNACAISPPSLVTAIEDGLRAVLAAHASRADAPEPS